jgi:hypothetical protein
VRSTMCTPSRARHAGVAVSGVPRCGEWVHSVAKVGAEAHCGGPDVPSCDGGELAQVFPLRRLCEGEGRADCVGAKVDRRHTILLD